METCVPKEYHDFFMDISETAMFDEYIRGKVVGAFKNVEILESKNGVMLIHCRKKSISTSSMKQKSDQSPRSSDVSKPFTPTSNEAGKHNLILLIQKEYARSEPAPCTKFESEFP